MLGTGVLVLSLTDNGFGPDIWTATNVLWHPRVLLEGMAQTEGTTYPENQTAK